MACYTKYPNFWLVLIWVWVIPSQKYFESADWQEFLRNMYSNNADGDYCEGAHPNIGRFSKLKQSDGTLLIHHEILTPLATQWPC